MGRGFHQKAPLTVTSRCRLGSDGQVNNGRQGMATDDNGAVGRGWIRLGVVLLRNFREVLRG